MTASPHGHAPPAHEAHQHGPGHGAGPVSWAMAATATLHCLTGCAIGEVLGMVIGTSVGLSSWATVALAVVLAFVFGYALTMRGVLRAGLPLRQALGVALAADKRPRSPRGRPGSRTSPFPGRSLCRAPAPARAPPPSL